MSWVILCRELRVVVFLALDIVRDKVIKKVLGYNIFDPNIGEVNCSKGTLEENNA